VPTLSQYWSNFKRARLFRGVKHRVYKARIPNQDARRGKSGGYRLLYYLRTESRVILLTIYSKTDQSDFEIREIERILRSWTPE